jgi:hypothetical protein
MRYWPVSGLTRIPEQIISLATFQFEGSLGNKGPLMTDDRQWPDDAEVQRFIIRKIAHDLSMFYAVEAALPPRLQALVQRLINNRN